MPLTRLSNGRLIYFAHVPKCAGTSIVKYLEARFGSLALFDPKFSSSPDGTNWSATSPQHIPDSARQRLLPDDFIDTSFATVRHPARRLASVFHFQREIEGAIADTISFSEWLTTIPGKRASNANALDGHLRSMNEIVPLTATVFPIEQGMVPVVRWLDAQDGQFCDSIKIPVANNLKARLEFAKRSVPSRVVTREDCSVIAEMYRDDYDRFGYEILPQDLEGVAL